MSLIPLAPFAEATALFFLCLNFSREAARQGANQLIAKAQPPSTSHLERRFLENDLHSFAGQLRIGEPPLA
jgi:hypothetical protein